MTTADTRAPAPASTTGTPAAAPPGDSGRALLARLEVRSVNGTGDESNYAVGMWVSLGN
ncbi:AAA family ATPase [Streptomyces lividans TK24]|nr:AAA family ATPase [Streptomyces lividans TK24]